MEANMYKGGNVTVMVSDMDRSIRFYTEALGLKLLMRAGNDWAEIESPGLNIGLHVAGQHGPKPGQQGALSIGLQVEKLEAAMATLKDRGVTFSPHIVEDGPIRLAFFGDPDGNP